MLIPTRLVAAAALLVCTSVPAQPTKFDGGWSVTMTCPPHNDADDDAKGYTHQLVGEVVDGQLTATHGKEGEPGWHLLKGKIQADGDAMLRLEGVVNNPRYAINDAQRGKKYTYRIKARFTDKVGTGQRLTGRLCQFNFAR